VLGGRAKEAMGGAGCNKTSRFNPDSEIRQL